MSRRPRQAFLGDDQDVQISGDTRTQTNKYKQTAASYQPLGRVADSPVGRGASHNRPSSNTSRALPLYAESLEQEAPNNDQSMDRALVSLGPLPSRYPPLPSIGGPSNALVPQSTADQYLSSVFPGGPNSKLVSYDALAAGDRYSLLDSRLQTTEKTSRSLVDEFLRFQNDIRMILDRHERFLSEERNLRSQNESVSHNTQDTMNQLLARMQRAEDRISESRDQILSISNQSRTLDATVQSTQKDLLTRKDFNVQRVAELKTALDEMTVARDRLESHVVSLQDEVRNLKFKYEAQSVDLSTILNELKHKTSQHDNDNRALLEVLKKTTQQSDVHDYQNAQIKSQVDARIMELREIVMILRQRVDSETADRRGSEQSIGAKITDLAAAIVEQNRRREEVVRHFEAAQSERERVVEQDRQRIQGRVAEIAEDVTKRILVNELRVREEMQSRFVNIEKVVEAEHLDRVLKEKLIVEESDKKFDLIRRGYDDELKAVKDIIRSERTKYGASLLKLDEAINLVDKHLENTRKQVDKILAAEITARKNTFKELHDRINGLDHKLLNLQQSLQENIQGLSSQMEVLEQQLKYAQEMASESAEIANQALRAADSHPIARPSSRPKEQEPEEAPRRDETPPPNERPDVYDRTTRTKIDMDAFKKSLKNQVQRQISDSQKAMTASLGDLDRRVGQLGGQVKILERDVKASNENFNNLSRTVIKNESELREKIDFEKDNRTDEINHLKQMINEIAGLESKGGADVNVAVALADQEIKRLKETLQNLKSQTQNKLGDEQHMRVDDVNNLQTEVKILRGALEKVSKDKLPNSQLRPPVADSSRSAGTKQAAPAADDGGAKGGTKSGASSKAPTTTSAATSATGTTGTEDTETETESKSSAKTPAKPAQSSPLEKKTTNPGEKKIAPPVKKPPTPISESETETETPTTSATTVTKSASKSQPAATAGKKKAQPSETEDDDDDDDDDDESEAKPPAKSGAKAAPNTKKPAVKDTEDEDDDDDDDDDETESTPPPKKGQPAKRK